MGAYRVLASVWRIADGQCREDGRGPADRSQPGAGWGSGKSSERQISSASQAGAKCRWPQAAALEPLASDGAACDALHREDSTCLLPIVCRWYRSAGRQSRRRMGAMHSISRFINQSPRAQSITSRVKLNRIAKCAVAAGPAHSYACDQHQRHGMSRRRVSTVTLANYCYHRCCCHCHNYGLPSLYRDFVWCR